MAVRWWVRIGLASALGVLLAAAAEAQDKPDPLAIGVDEHLGQTLPLDLTFYNEQGEPVRLAEMIDRPTVLSPVYFRCASICTPLLTGLVDVLERMELEPHADYNILTISFDETDTPDLAARKRMNFLKSFHEPFPEAAWRFMTGDSAAIATLTDAVGFRYERQGRDFLHPGLLTVLTPEGKIARYLYGITFLPFDLKLAILEAAQGRSGPTINRVLLYCFSYDPDGQKYVFNLLKVVGTVVMFFAAGFVAWLVITTRRSRKES